MYRLSLTLWHKYLMLLSMYFHDGGCCFFFDAKVVPDQYEEMPVLSTFEHMTSPVQHMYGTYGTPTCIVPSKSVLELFS